MTCAPVRDDGGSEITSGSRETWLAARRTGIGASDAWRLFAEPYALWAQKRGLVEEDDLGDLEFVRWGHLLEPVVLAELGRRAGVVATGSGVLVRSTVHPWALATLDGIAVTGGESYPVECKTAGPWRADEWADGAPPRYRWQVQHQMLVTGAPRVLLGCLLGGQRLVWSWVDRDEAAIAAIIAAGSALWARVLSGDAPDPDGSTATARALAAVYPRDDGETVVLDGEMIDVGAEIDVLAAEIAEREKRVDVLKARVKSAIGKHSYGLTLDGSGWTWKVQERAAYSVKTSTSRVLRRVKSKADRGGV